MESAFSGLTAKEMEDGRKIHVDCIHGCEVSFYYTDHTNKVTVEVTKGNKSENQEIDAKNFFNIFQTLKLKALLNITCIKDILTDDGVINLKGVNLSDVDLKRADLSGADLSNAKLDGVDLTHANVSMSVLIEADLTNANLIRADLSNADLTDANLSSANLKRANLSGAILTRANLLKINVEGTNMAGTNPFGL